MLEALERARLAQPESFTPSMADLLQSLEPPRSSRDWQRREAATMLASMLERAAIQGQEWYVWIRDVYPHSYRKSSDNSAGLSPGVKPTEIL